MTFRKFPFFLLIGTVLAPTPAQANLLVSEPFNYPAGALNSQGSAANGLSGSWAATNGTDSMWNVASSGLTMPGVLSSGNSASFSQTAAGRSELYATRSLTSALPTNTLYGSFLFSIPTKSPVTAVQFGVILGNASDSDNTASFFYSGDGYGTLNPLVKAENTSVTGGLAATQGQTYLYLFQSNTTTGNTQVWILNAAQYANFSSSLDAETLNNVTTNTELASGVVFRASVTATGGAGPINAIRLLGYSRPEASGGGPGTSGYEARVDEFRISDTNLLEAVAGSQTVSGATPIQIANPSFEVDSIAGSNAPISQDLIPSGWTSGGTGSMGVLAPDAGEPNSYYNGTTLGYSGNKIGYLFNNASIKQTLTEVIEPNTTYTLSLAVGNRNRDTWGGYHVTLGASTGELVGDWVGVTRNLTLPGSFAKTSRSFTTGPNPPGKGSPLVIKIEEADSSANRYLDIDNIVLTKVAAAPRPAATPVDVYIVAGQSNCHGWKANVANLSSANVHYVNDPSPRSLLAYKECNNGDTLYNKGSVGGMSPTGAGHADTFIGFGPELSAGKEMSLTHTNRVAIVKFCVSGASLQTLFRKPANALYPILISHVQSSLQQMTEQGYTPQLKGMFWLQGEYDATAAYSPLYSANISQFVQDLRQDLGVPRLKFIGTEINPNMPNFSSTQSYVAAVNQGLRDLANSDPDARFVTTADITSGFADGIHYNADQTIMIGQRWAAMEATIPLSFSEWQTANFSSQEITNGVGAPGADSDQDGMSNLMEYALGGSPKTSESSLVSLIEQNGSHGIQFTRDLRKTDVRYTIEGSDKLDNWTVLTESNGGAAFSSPTDGGTLTEQGAGLSKVQFIAGPHAARYFLRLKVSQ